MQLKLVGAPAGTVCREPKPVRVSVAMMVGNEAHFIADAIRSAQWADEIVILDTGSTDGTDDIARSMGARVVRESWRTVDLGDGLWAIDNFGSARTRSIELAQGDWVVLLDADERFDAPHLREILETLPDCIMWGGMPLEHEGRPELAQTMVRLFRRESRPVYKHRLHEVLCERVRHMPYVALPIEAGRVVHLGGAHETRKQYRREERNWRIVQRMLDEDRNDIHALSYAAEMLCDMGRDKEAEVLASHAFRLCTPDTAARHRVTLALCEFAWRRQDVAAVRTILDEAASRWKPDANSIAGRAIAAHFAGDPDAADLLRAAAPMAPEMTPIMRDQLARMLALHEVPHAAE